MPATGPRYAQCPCCGGKVPKGHLLVDVSAAVAVCDRQIVKLSNQMADILWVLNEAYPNSVTNDLMIRKIFGLNEPNDPNGTISVTISNHKRVLLPLGVMIIPTRVAGESARRLKLHGLKYRWANDHERTAETTENDKYRFHRFGGNYTRKAEPPDNPPKEGVTHHGISGYTRGCRCRVCAMAHRDYSREYNRNRYWEKKRDQEGEIFERIEVTPPEPKETAPPKLKLVVSS